MFSIGASTNVIIFVGCRKGRADFCQKKKKKKKKKKKVLGVDDPKQGYCIDTDLTETSAVVLDSLALLQNVAKAEEHVRKH